MRLKVELEPNSILHAYVQALCSLLRLHACTIYTCVIHQNSETYTVGQGSDTNTWGACEHRGSLSDTNCIEFFLFLQTQSTTCPCMNPGT